MLLFLFVALLNIVVAKEGDKSLKMQNNESDCECVRERERRVRVCERGCACT